MRLVQDKVPAEKSEPASFIQRLPSEVELASAQVPEHDDGPAADPGPPGTGLFGENEVESDASEPEGVAWDEVVCHCTLCAA